MIIAKSNLQSPHGHVSELEAFPNTDQWLQIVGFSESPLKVCLMLLKLLQLGSCVVYYNVTGTIYASDKSTQLNEHQLMQMKHLNVRICIR